MAKPKSFVDLASTATSSTSRLHSHETASPRPRRPTPPSSSPRPSSNLLALLATVAASSSSADGRPLSPEARPPDFLCPFLPPHFLADHVPLPRHDSASDESQEEDLYRGTPTPTRVKRVSNPGTPHVPDKFVQGVDGRWRKEHSWTLYGSTYCDCTASAGDHSQTDVPEVDDQIDPTVQPTSSSTPLPTATDMTAELPPGWGNSKTDEFTPYILVLALVLAVGISLLIFGCAMWRRRRKRQSTNKDLEKKLRKHRVLYDDSDDELEDKMRARAQQRRLWVKATARFRPNLKITSRRRRKKAAAAMSGDTSSAHSTAKGSMAEVSLSTDSLTREPFPDTTGPTTTSPSSLAPSSDIPVPDGETLLSEGPEPVPNGPSHDLRPSHPPDYLDDGANGEACSSSSLDCPVHMVTSDDVSLVDGPHTAQMTRPSGRPSHVAAAHIATDDKSLLARMASLVSSPPEDELFVAAQSSRDTTAQHGPSVPVIEELEAMSPALLETLESDLRKGPEVVWTNNLSPPSSSFQPALSNSIPVPTYSREPSPHPPMFPAPPSKAQLAAPQFYEYPATFEEDIVDPVSDIQPSAPMFEYPSAPEDDSHPHLDAVPCAPPLIDEEDELNLGLGRVCAPAPPPSSDDVHVARSGTDPSGRASSGAALAFPSSQLERTTSPPDYLP